ncbi:hypothetical protein DPMN_155117 [Dreissena polymorpha]|uniref:Uncharacterized protein n=1 Tax=Dreissena polymorpha TaxID=45954 RepID=A0A9D4FNX4_DREPO|nr:hypothetical protein DPMN_155117 [Dreissena polymorpha]
MFEYNPMNASKAVMPHFFERLSSIQTDRQTDRQDKNDIPPIIPSEGKKSVSRPVKWSLIKRLSPVLIIISHPSKRKSHSLMEISRPNNISRPFNSQSPIKSPSFAQSNGQSVTQSNIAQSNSQSPSLISPSLMVSQSLSLIAFTQSNFQSFHEDLTIKVTLRIQLVTKFGEDRMKFLGQTDKQTDRLTDRQSDSYIAPITNGNEGDDETNKDIVDQTNLRKQLNVLTNFKLGQAIIGSNLLTEYMLKTGDTMDDAGTKGDHKGST